MSASLRRVEPAVHGLVRGGLPRAAASSPAHAGRRCLQQSRSPSPLFGHSLSSRLGGSASSSFSTGVQRAGAGGGGNTQRSGKVQR
eukprot:jgi/Mesen1/1972/ME000147S01070